MKKQDQKTYETLAALLTVLAILFWLTELPVFLILCIVLGLAGSLFHPLALLIHRLWMYVARALNFVISKLLLSIIFVLVLTPIALLYRLFNKKKLMTEGDKTSFYYEVNQSFIPKDLENPW